MNRQRLALGVFAMVATASIQACASHLPSAPVQSQTPSFDSKTLGATNGSNLHVKFTPPGYNSRKVQYVAGDIEQLAIGLYDTRSSAPFSFDPNGLIKTNAGLLLPLLTNEPSYMAQIRALLGDTLSQDARYMIRQYTTSGPIPSSPVSVEFNSVPDGTYTVFALAVRSGVFIGRATSSVLVNPAQRVGNTNDLPLQSLSMSLDPNPDVPTETTIINNTATPSF